MLGLKDALEPRNSTLHQATVAAHGFMFAGTANTSFVREQMDWFKRSSNWAKFGATASIGVIHRPKATLAQSKAELQLYLPQGSGSTSPYSEGGALYALGLIHAAKAGDVTGAEGVVPYLLETLDAMGPNEPIQHGACLAVSLTIRPYNLHLEFRRPSTRGFSCLTEFLPLNIFCLDSFEW